MFKFQVFPLADEYQPGQLKRLNFILIIRLIGSASHRVQNQVFSVKNTFSRYSLPYYHQNPCNLYCDSDDLAIYKSKLVSKVNQN